jgi:hypothetical protein
MCYERKVGHPRSCSASYTVRVLSLAFPLAFGALAFFGMGLVETEAQIAPGAGAGPIYQVPLSEIEKEATISEAPGVTIDFSNGGANNIAVKTTDNPDVVQITSKTNAVTVARGSAHLTVANIGHCPKPTGTQMVLCDPIPVYSVTINVR